MEYNVEWSGVYKFNDVIDPSFRSFNGPGVYVHLFEIRRTVQIVYVGSAWDSVLGRQLIHSKKYETMHNTMYDLDRIGSSFATLYQCLNNREINDCIEKGIIVLGSDKAILDNPRLLAMKRSNKNNLLFSCGEIKNLRNAREDVQTVESLLQKYLISTYRIGQYPNKNGIPYRNRNLLGGIPRPYNGGHTMRSTFLETYSWQKDMFGTDATIQDSSLEIYR